jgi:hypothetical protein
MTALLPSTTCRGFDEVLSLRCWENLANVIPRYVWSSVPWPIVRDEVAQLLQIESVEIHHLVPGRNEVLHEFLLSVGERVDLRNRPEL